MDILVSSGVISLGLVIGMLVGWFINEDQEFTIGGLVASVTVLSGSGVVGVFQLVAPQGSTREFWFYPIAILVGLLIAPFLDRLYNDLYEPKSKRSK